MIPDKVPTRTFFDRFARFNGVIYIAIGVIGILGTSIAFVIDSNKWSLDDWWLFGISVGMGFCSLSLGLWVYFRGPKLGKMVLVVWIAFFVIVFAKAFFEAR